MSDCPTRGEVRIINGKKCRFIERELEGDKWEVIDGHSPIPAAPSDVAVERAAYAIFRVMRPDHMTDSDWPNGMVLGDGNALRNRCTEAARAALASLKGGE